MKKTLILWILLIVVIFISIFGYLFLQKKKQQKQILSDQEQFEKKLIQDLENYEPLPNPKTDQELIKDLENAPKVENPLSDKEVLQQLEDFNNMKK